MLDYPQREYPQSGQVSHPLAEMSPPKPQLGQVFVDIAVEPIA